MINSSCYFSAYSLYSGISLFISLLTTLEFNVLNPLFLILQFIEEWPFSATSYVTKNDTQLVKTFLILFTTETRKSNSLNAFVFDNFRTLSASLSYF